MDDLNITRLVTPFNYSDQSINKLVEISKIQTPFVYSDQKLSSSKNISKVQVDSFAGTGFISGISPGIVTKENVPYSAVLNLFERNTSKIIRSTVSNLDGTYIFPDLNMNYTYDIIARDPLKVYMDTIIPDITPQSKIFQADTPTVIYSLPFEGTFKISGGMPPYSLVYEETSGVSLSIDNYNLTIDITELEGTLSYTILDSTDKSLDKEISYQQQIFLTGEQGVSNLTSFGTFSDDNNFDTTYSKPFFGISRRVFVGSNSYITFGSGSNTYSSFSATNPGIGIILFAADHGYGQLYTGLTTDINPNAYPGLILRYTSTRIGNQIQETILYDNGIISIYPVSVVNMSNPTFYSDGTTTTNIPLTVGSMTQLIPNGSASYTITNEYPQGL